MSTFNNRALFRVLSNKLLFTVLSDRILFGILNVRVLFGVLSDKFVFRVLSDRALFLRLDPVQCPLIIIVKSKRLLTFLISAGIIFQIFGVKYLNTCKPYLAVYTAPSDRSLLRVLGPLLSLLFPEYRQIAIY